MAEPLEWGGEAMFAGGVEPSSPQWSQVSGGHSFSDSGFNEGDSSVVGSSSFVDDDRQDLDLRRNAVADELAFGKPKSVRDSLRGRAPAHSRQRSAAAPRRASRRCRSRRC